MPVASPTLLCSIAPPPPRYNPKSEETTWHIPPEVEAQAALRLDPVKAKMLERAKAMGAQVAPEYAAGALASSMDAVPWLLMVLVDWLAACGDLAFISYPILPPPILPSAAVGGPGGAAGAAEEDDFDVTFTEDDLGLGGEEAEPQAAPGAEPEAEAAPEAEADAAAAHAAPPAAGPPSGGMPPPHMPSPHVPPPHMPPPPHMGHPPHMPPPPMPPGQQHWPGQPPRPGMPPHPGMPHHHGGMPPRLSMPPPPRPPQYKQPPPVHPTQPRPPAPQQHQQQQPQPQHKQQQAQQGGLPSYLPAPPEAPGKTGYGPSGYMPVAEAMAAFKALLAEKGVHAFSRWV